MPETEITRLEYQSPELIFGLVCAVGTNYQKIRDALSDGLRQFDYKPTVVRLSEHLETLADVEVGVDQYRRISQLMDAGNKIRKTTNRDDIVGLAALARLNSDREAGECNCARRPLERRAHILLTLKNPREAETLRRVYGSGFFLIGVHAPEERRMQYLTSVQSMSKEQARKLIERDEEEEDSFGQQTRRTFEMADVFVDERNYEEQLRRFLDLVFGHPYTTPTVDEHAMYLACGAGLRSGQLGRQVGAAILSQQGDIIATGCNDVPRAGGGLYWPGEEDQRDHVLGYDSNDRSRNAIIDDIVKKLNLETRDWRQAFRSTKLWEITEYGRAVHAEMDALLACARTGASPVGATLYTTTFPCHNCMRHIIGAGISRVVYIEPYPKSHAMDLHFDSIRVDGKAQPAGTRQKIPCDPFIGVGPRRYLQLFSMTLGEGSRLERKKDGVVVAWHRETAEPRVPLAPRSYLQQEQIAVKLFRDAIDPEVETAS